MPTCTACYLDAYGAQSALDEGRWDDAVALADSVLGEPYASTLPPTLAYVVLGLVHARRGEPDAGAFLDKASSLAAPTGELQWLAPVAAARAELALLESRASNVGPETDEAFELARGKDAPWVTGELACLRHRAGIRDGAVSALPEPFALELAGDNRGQPQHGPPWAAPMRRRWSPATTTCS